MLNDVFALDFMWRALIAGAVVSVCAALLGVNLVLRKSSMIGDGLSHVAFGAFAIALVLQITPLVLAIPVATLVAIIILRSDAQRSVSNEAIIALVSASALALGTTVVSITGTSIDLNAYLFGSILAISASDFWLCIILGVAVIAFFAICYHRIFAITFDATFARTSGVTTKRYQTLLAIFCAVTIVLGMKLLGALLISSLIIFPCLTSLQFSQNFRQATLYTAGISVFCFILGLIASFVLNTPTGASIVLVNLAVLVICRFLRRWLRA